MTGQNTFFVLCTVVLFQTVYGSRLIASEICQEHAEYIQGGTYLFTFPGHCDKYIQCDEWHVGTVRYCASGTFWNGTKSFCQDSDLAYCPDDPCSYKPSHFRYRDEHSCFAFYKCVYGYSMSKRCPNGESFHSDKKICVEDPECFREKPHGCIGNIMPHPGYSNKFILGTKETGYVFEICPDGLIFNPKKCVCDWPKHRQLFPDHCFPLFHFTFDGTFKEVHDQVYLEAVKVKLQENSVYLGKHSDILIPLGTEFDFNNEFALLFRARYSGPQTYKDVVIFENSLMGDGSVRITIIPTEGTVTLTVHNMDGTRYFDLTIAGVDFSDYHEFFLWHTDNMINFAVDDKTRYYDLDSDFMIGRTREPFVFGNGFVGFIDDILFYNCIPDFLQESLNASADGPELKDTIPNDGKIH